MPTQHTWYEEEKESLMVLIKEGHEAVINDEEVEEYHEKAKSWIQEHNRRLLEKIEKGLEDIDKYPYEGAAFTPIRMN